MDTFDDEMLDLSSHRETALAYGFATIVHVWVTSAVHRAAVQECGQHVGEGLGAWKGRTGLGYGNPGPGALNRR